MWINPPPTPPAPPPVAIPDPLTSCRHCLTIHRVTPGLLIGLDGSTTCDRNTEGCGEACGYFCGCDGSGWVYGPHEADLR